MNCDCSATTRATRGCLSASAYVFVRRTPRLRILLLPLIDVRQLQISPSLDENDLPQFAVLVILVVEVLSLHRLLHVWQFKIEGNG